MFRVKGRPEMFQVTKSKATWFAQMQSVPRDRDLTEWRTNGLGKAFRDGLAITFQWGIAELDGVQYRVNGKHSSTELASMDHMPDAWVCLTTYLCETAEDVAVLYAQFDGRISARTPNDIYYTMATACESIAQLPKALIVLGVTGLSYNHWDCNDINKTAVDKGQLMLAHPDFMLWLHTLTQNLETNRAVIWRKPVVAAMARTWFKSRVAATEFWEAVKTGSDADPSSPSRRLRDYLLKSALFAGRGAGSGKKTAFPREMFVKCLHAWNAWRSERTTDLKYHPKAPIPKAA